jgi:hypothetical protein
LRLDTSVCVTLGRQRLLLRSTLALASTLDTSACVSACFTLNASACVTLDVSACFTLDASACVSACFTLDASTYNTLDASACVSACVTLDTSAFSVTLEASAFLRHA